MNSENLRLSELWEKHYFIFVKLGYVLLMAAYMLLHSEIAYRSNVLTLAMAAVCSFVMAVYETTASPKRYGLMVAETVCVLAGIKYCGGGFTVLLPVAIGDAVSVLRLPPYLFALSLIGMLAVGDKFTYLMICLLTAVIYWQHTGIILRYRKSAVNYEEQELQLKNSIETSAADFQNEIRRTNLHYENVMLQDKARLSQALHDKLGHRINGSVYQLEACRAIARSHPDKADEILGRVTQSLRDGMDEIRAVLRSERPDDKRMTLLGLNLLCEECKSQYGIDAQLTIEGDSGRISEKMWWTSRLPDLPSGTRKSGVPMPPPPSACPSGATHSACSSVSVTKPTALPPAATRSCGQKKTPSRPSPNCRTWAPSATSFS